MAKRKRKRGKRGRKSTDNNVSSQLDTAAKTSDARLDQAQNLVALTTLTEAFAIGSNALAEQSALRSERKFQNAQITENAKRLEKAADETIVRGKTEAARTLERARQTVGTQRAQTAAQGLDVDFGSAQDVQLETLQFGAEDAAAIKTNAFREAFNFERQAINLKSEAAQRRISGKARERQTALTGGLQFARAISQGTGTFVKAKGTK